MANSSEDVDVKFGASIEGLTEGVSSIKEHLEGLSGPIKELVEGFLGIGEAVLGAFAVEAIAKWTESITKAGEEAIKMASTLGMTIEEASRFSGVMEVFTGTAEGAMHPLERLQRAVGSALTDPTSTAAKAFSNLGISMEEMNAAQGDSTKQLDILREAFQKFADGGGKTEAFMEIMGRGFDHLIPLLNKSKEEFEEYNKKVDETGSVIGPQLAHTMETSSESIHLMDLSFKGLGNTIYGAFQPAIDALIKGITDLVQGFNEAIKSNFGFHAVLTTLVVAVDGVVMAFLGLKLVFQELEKSAEYMTTTILGFLKEIGAAIDDLIHHKFGEISKDTSEIWNRTKESQLHILDSMKDDYSDYVASIKDLTKNLHSGAGVVTGTEGGDKSPKDDRPKAKLLGAGGKDPEEDQTANFKKAMDEDTIIVKGHYKTRQELRLADLESERSKDESSVELGLMSEQEKLKDFIRITNQEYAIRRETLENERDLYKQGSKEYEEYTNQIELLAVKQRNDLMKIDQKIAADSNKTWTDITATIKSSFSSMITGILQGTQTWQKAMIHLFSNLVSSIVGKFANIAVDWAAQQIKMVFATQAKNAAIMASDATAAAAKTAASAESKIADSATVMQDAGTAAANVYKSVAAIPFVGWLLAPLAAGAAFAAVSAFGSFDVGAWEIPSDMGARIHKGEMIIPADVASGIRAGGAVPNFASGASSSGAGFSGGSSVNFHVSAVDSGSVKRLLENQGRNISKILNNRVRNADTSLTSAFRMAT